MKICILLPPTENVRLRYGNMVEDINTTRRVRQDCILLPVLSNMYYEHVFQKALYNINEGIQINGVVINNLRYADDSVLMEDTFEVLQNILTTIVSHCENMASHLISRRRNV